MTKSNQETGLEIAVGNLMVELYKIQKSEGKQSTIFKIDVIVNMLLEDKYQLLKSLTV